MGIRKTANRSTQYATKGVGYSSGQSKPGVSAGKSGSCNVNVGNKAGNSEAINRKGISSAFKDGGRA